MKKLICAVLGTFLISPVFAESDLSNILNKVSLQLKTEKWITTKTAQVIVGVNAGVADAGIEKIQTQILGKLAQLSNQGEWHIVSYNRQQDKSGLESIQISAEARLPQTELGNLRGKAKSMSKPGETYTIDDVRFTPSDEENLQANILMRGMIYNQAKAEIETLNKVYPDQKFYLYHIDFNMMPVAMPMMAMAKSMNDVASQPLNVGSKVEMVASVTLAAMPDILTLKKSPLMNP
jgi:hypothetical protein